MDKQVFYQIYRPLLRTWFAWDVFFKDDNITLTQGLIPFKELLDFKVVRYEKDGHPDNRRIEDQLKDPKIQIITLRRAREDPADWDLAGKTLSISDVKSIPIAKDPLTNQAIILDSNHLLANLVCQPKTKLPVIIVSGPDLTRMVEDFKIANRAYSRTRIRPEV